MPGDEWQKAANLRLLLGHQIGHPGKKLLFMGGEFGQLAEWNADTDLQWSLLINRMHAGMQEWLRALLGLYRQTSALWDDGPEHFQWIDFDDRNASVVAYRRIGEDPSDNTVFVFNFTPVVRSSYCLRLPEGGRWRCLLHPADEQFGGSGLHPAEPCETESVETQHLAAQALQPFAA